MRPGTDRGLVGDLKVVHSAEVRTAFGYSERDPLSPSEACAACDHGDGPGGMRQKLGTVSKTRLKAWPGLLGLTRCAARGR